MSDSIYLAKRGWLRYFGLTLLTSLVIAMASCGGGNNTAVATSTTIKNLTAVNGCNTGYDSASFEIRNADGSAVHDGGLKNSANGSGVAVLYSHLCEFVRQHEGSLSDTVCPRMPQPGISYRMIFDGSDKTEGSEIIYQPNGCAFFQMGSRKAYEETLSTTFDALSNEISTLFRLDPTKVRNGTLTDAVSR